MKKDLTLFHQNLQSRAVRKIRLRYVHTGIHQILPCYHMSISLLSHFARACDQNIYLRAGSNPTVGIESQICIQKGDYVFFFQSLYQEPSNTQGGAPYSLLSIRIVQVIIS
jgi:hypothetical protein